MPLTIAAGGDRVFYLRGGELVSADISRGEDIWTAEIARKAVRFGSASSPTLLVHHNIVYLANQGELSARNRPGIGWTFAGTAIPATDAGFRRCAIASTGAPGSLYFTY